MDHRDFDYYSHYDEDDLEHWKSNLLYLEEMLKGFDFGLEPDEINTEKKDELRMDIEELNYKIEKLSQILEERKKQSEEMMQDDDDEYDDEYNYRTGN
tara:strand:+ start:1102 stop:1395 length:294 start_codon:yes stop_codon:yes gene_type:complete